MTKNSTNWAADPREKRSLPHWLAVYARYGPYALILGVVLCVLALFTNAVPDPSFPWFSLPANYRLGLTQPRIEHWPVSYTVGVWLWVFFAPAIVLRGYEHLSGRWGLGRGTWLVGLPTIAMFGLTTYCRLFWPKPEPATWNAPAYTFVCWAYCSTYDLLWSDLAYLIALLGGIATILAVRRQNGGGYALLGFGVLALPLGLPAAYEGYRRVTETET